MDNQFTITINDEKGVKQYDMHTIIVKAVKFFALFVLSVIIVSLFFIYTLNNQVDNITKKSYKIQEKSRTLDDRNQNLIEAIAVAEKKLKHKRLELDGMADSLSELESIVGIKSHPELPFTQRVDMAKIDSTLRQTLLKFIPNGSPIEYNGITSKFGYRIHPVLKRRMFHRGIDLKAKRGIPIYATADGIVDYAGKHRKSGFGRLIIIQHNYGFKTYFGHLKKVATKVNRVIHKGDLIGYTGNSGRSSGPHLHYEVRFMNRPFNPYYFIKWTMKNYDELFKKEKKIPWQSLIETVATVKLTKQIQEQP